MGRRELTSLTRGMVPQVQGPAPAQRGKLQHDESPLSASVPRLGWGSVLISGKVVTQQGTCTDSNGLAALNMTVQEMPDDFATAAVTCKFVPWNVMEELSTAVQQVLCTPLAH